MTDTLDRVKTYQQFIGGQWVDAASGETIDVENPADGTVIAQSRRRQGRRRSSRGRRRHGLRDLAAHDAPGPEPALLKLADAIEARADSSAG